MALNAHQVVGNAHPTSLPAVVDGRMIGIVTRSDVMCYFYDLLPD
jgi:CBS domain-containing protein